MTDRAHALTVTLIRDIRVDDVEHIMGAIGMLKGVLKVAPNLVDHETISADIRASHDMEMIFYELERAMSKHGPAKLRTVIEELAKADRSY